MADQNQGEQTPEIKPDAPDYEKAVRDGQHFDPSATMGTNFAPDVVIAPGQIAPSQNIPGGDYYALRKIREEGRARIAAESAAAAAGQPPDSRTLQQGGLSIVFETDKAGMPVADSVRVLGSPTADAESAIAGAETGAGGASATDTATAGGQVTTATPQAGAAATDAGGGSSRNAPR